MRQLALILMLVLSFLSISPVHAQNPELITNGISHLYWGFPDNSSWINRDGWKLTCGTDCNMHKTVDFYAQDWNDTDTNDCNRSFYAPFGGKILFAGIGSLSSYGKQVIIQSTANQTFAFRVAHLNETYVATGNTVNKGDLIGLIGNTTTPGTSTGCHAHTALYRNLNATDIANLRIGSNTNVLSKAAPFCLDQAQRFENWIGGHGQNSTTQLLSDVNGDKLDDAVVFFSGGGSWYVSLSNGSSFRPFTNWINGHGAGSDAQFLADVNADGKADSIIFFKSTGQWYVAKSDGTKFLAYTLWRSGFGMASTKTLMADVNGDNRADAITFVRSSGTWQVAKTNTTAIGFETPTTWATGHGINSTNQLMGDATGDGKADAVAFFGNNGIWYVAPTNSGSTAFTPSTTAWISGHGTGSTRQFLARFDDDTKTDAIVFFGSNGGWYVSTSTGAKFNPFWVWTTGHGAGSTMQLMGNVDEVSVTKPRSDAIVFFSSIGGWYVTRSCGL